MRTSLPCAWLQVTIAVIGLFLAGRAESLWQNESAAVIPPNAPFVVPAVTKMVFPVAHAGVEAAIAVLAATAISRTERK